MKRKETNTSSELTASTPFSTTRFSYDKAGAVRYAKEMLTSLANVSPLTIIIEPEKSEGFFVHTVTGLSSEDIQTLISYRVGQNTSDKAQVG